MHKAVKASAHESGTAVQDKLEHEVPRTQFIVHDSIMRACVWCVCVCVHTRVRVRACVRVVCVCAHAMNTCCKYMTHM